MPAQAGMTLSCGAMQAAATPRPRRPSSTSAAPWRRSRRRASSAWRRRLGSRGLLRRRAAGRALPPRARAAAALGAGVDQRRRLVERDGLRRLVVRQVGVDAVVADVGAVAAVLGDDHAALLRMLAELLAGVGAEAAALAGIELLLLDQRHRAIEPDRRGCPRRCRCWRRSCRASRKARSGRRRR